MEFESVDPCHDRTDLLPFLDLVGKARVVGLGECTHGTREFNRLRHRLIELLVLERGFTAVALEECVPKACRVNEFIQEGRGDAADVLRRNLYWALRTEETLDLVRWMREQKVRGGEPVEFVGADVQDVEQAVARVGEIVGRADPALATSLAERYEPVLAADRDRELRGRGIQTWIPPEEVRGRHVRLSGSLRTRDADESAFFYFWTGDGQGTLVGDTLEGRRPERDSDWRESVIDLDIPAGAEFVSLGVMLGGNGTAWIDALRLEVDGAAWSDPDRLDLAFASEDLTGWWVDDKNLVDRDPAVMRGGRPTLRIRPAKPIPPCATTTDDAARLSREIHDDLVSQEDGLAEALSPARAAGALRSALMVVQAHEILTGGGDAARDRLMAENILSGLERRPGAKVVYWAHNGHVRRGGGAAGAHLARALGDDYVPVGFTSAEGTYLALHPKWSEGFGEFPLVDPPADSFEAGLRGLGVPRRILDLRTIREDDPDLGFLTDSRPFRSIGASALPEQFFELRIRDEFDGLVWLEETTAAQGLPRIE